MHRTGHRALVCGPSVQMQWTRGLAAVGHTQSLRPDAPSSCAAAPAPDPEIAGKLPRRAPASDRHPLTGDASCDGRRYGSSADTPRGYCCQRWPVATPGHRGPSTGCRPARHRPLRRTRQHMRSGQGGLRATHRNAVTLIGTPSRTISWFLAATALGRAGRATAVEDSPVGACVSGAARRGTAACLRAAVAMGLWPRAWYVQRTKEVRYRLAGA